MVDNIRNETSKTSEAVKKFIADYKKINKLKSQNEAEIQNAKFNKAILFSEAKESLCRTDFKKFCLNRSIKIADTQRKKYVKAGVLLKYFGQLTVHSQLNFEKVYLISCIHNPEKLKEVIEFVCTNKLPDYNDNFFKNIISNINLKHYEVEKAFIEAEDEYNNSKSKRTIAIKLKERTTLKDMIEKLTLENKELLKENRTLRDENNSLKEQLYKRYNSRKRI